MAATTTSDFQFPPEHNGPPLYTLQPNLTSRAAQQETWSTIIQAYCAHQRLFRLSLSAAITSPLFTNTAIHRKLSLADAGEVLAGMVSAGRAEWCAKDKAEAWIYWKTPAEWAGVFQ
jgi:ESCRT-II complex subunit VPS25